MTADDPDAERPTDELLALVYDDLRRRAAAIVGRQRADATLQPTALVHEAYAKLADRTTDWADRQHFMRTAACAMRQVLIDHARAARTDKRGGRHARVTLHGLAGADGATLDVIDLDDALTELAEVSERSARVVELRFLAGLSLDETAEVLGVTNRTVSADWRAARAWLRDRLQA